jgi:hypothetical protein
MAKGNQKDLPIDFEALGRTLAKLSQVQRRFIEESQRCGDEAFARRKIEEVRSFTRMVREGLEAQLRDGELENLTPAAAQQAIYGCQIVEAMLQADVQREH